MKTSFNGRSVEIEHIEHGSDCCDSYIDSAYYLDTEQELNDEELYQLTEENQELIYESWHEYQIDRAEFLYDSYKDGTYEH